MPLTDTDRTALCHHLADRFPDYSDRARIARDSGLADAQLTGEPLAVWAGLVAEAESVECVARLLYVASQLRPDDATLAQMSASASEGTLIVPAADNPKLWLRNTAVAGVLVLLLGAGAIAGDVVLGLGGPAAMDGVADPSTSTVNPSGTTSSLPLIADVSTPTTNLSSTASSAPSTAAASTSTTNPSGTTLSPPATAAATSTITPSNTTLSAPSTAEPVRSAVSSVGPCAGPADKVVGYAYAGATRPSGSTWRVPRGLNVRRDYPRKENGWSSKTGVVCVLPRDTVVQVHVPPIAVGGGVWWVPIRGGSAGH